MEWGFWLGSNPMLFITCKGLQFLLEFQFAFQGHFPLEHQPVRASCSFPPELVGGCVFGGLSKGELFSSTWKHHGDSVCFQKLPS